MEGSGKIYYYQRSEFFSIKNYIPCEKKSERDKERGRMKREKDWRKKINKRDNEKDRA